MPDGRFLTRAGRSTPLGHSQVPGQFLGSGVRFPLNGRAWALPDTLWTGTADSPARPQREQGPWAWGCAQGLQTRAHAPGDTSCASDPQPVQEPLQNDPTRGRGLRGQPGAGPEPGPQLLESPSPWSRGTDPATGERWPGQPAPRRRPPASSRGRRLARSKVTVKTKTQILQKERRGQKGRTGCFRQSRRSQQAAGEGASVSPDEPLPSAPRSLRVCVCGGVALCSAPRPRVTAGDLGSSPPTG